MAGKGIGHNELARAIRDFTNDKMNGAYRYAVLGTLDGGLNLKVDGFGPTIPKSDYHVLDTKVRMYNWPEDLYREDYRLELLLKPGDRVLCIPIEDGHTFLLVGHAL